MWAIHFRQGGTIWPPLRKKTGTHDKLIMVLLLIGLAQTVFVGPLRADRLPTVLEEPSWATSV